MLTIEVKDGRDAFLNSGLLIKGNSFKTFVGGTENHVPVLAAPTGEIRVEENTKAVATFTATDPDAGQTLRFSIGGADAGHFDIDAATGALTFKNAPNFEKPQDSDRDNVYDIFVDVRDNGSPSQLDTEAVRVRVTDAPEPTSVLTVKFISEDTPYKNSLGWYDTTTGKGGMLFPNVKSQGVKPPLTPGVSMASFTVPSDSVGDIAFFLVPNASAIRQNTRAELTGKIVLLQTPNGLWAAAAADASGNLIKDASGAPSLLLELALSRSSARPRGTSRASTTCLRLQAAPRRRRCSRATPLTGRWA